MWAKATAAGETQAGTGGVRMRSHPLPRIPGCAGKQLSGTVMFSSASESLGRGGNR